MQCAECGLENTDGAMYCAKCHALLPRPPAPNECPLCGYIPADSSPLPPVCPECGNDAERGKAVREQRIARLKAGFMLEIQQMELQQQRLKPRKRAGCLPLVFGAGVVLKLMLGFYFF
jgi:hypothetical protein